MTTIDTHTVWVTFFPDTLARKWSGGETTLPQLAKGIAAMTAASKAKLPLLKLAKFGDKRSDKNCLRTDENVKSVTGIEVEHDAGEIAFEVAIEIVRKAKLRALAYTSPSWVAGVKEKWRILLPLAQDHAPASRAELVARVNGLFGGKLTDECFVLSQTFYFGHLDGCAHRVEVIDGDFLDHRDDLKTGAVGKSTGERKRRDNVLAFSERDRTTPARSRDEIMKLLEKSQTNNRDGSGNWHNAMLAATASMIGHGWSDDEIFDATEPYCERGWGDDDIAEMIESGRKKWDAPDPGWFAKGGLGQIIKQATESTPDTGGGGGTPRPVIRYGALSDMADEAAAALIGGDVAFYQRGNKLVRPVVVAAQTFRGGATTVAQLVEVELPYLRDTLCRHSHWFKFDMKSKKWLATHPHKEASLVLLKKFGDWKFPVIAGIITTPTLRPDGTILSQAGYDPTTQLLLIDPPDMPEIPEQPTKADALVALELLSGLLVEFRFDDDGGVSRAVALSAMLSTVCRGAYPVLPMHVIDAPAAGSGKSYLLSLVGLIATGQEMPVLGSSNDEVEMEKRIGAELIHGQTLICIDNVVGELGGQALCQLIEQHRPSVRILGKSQNVEARGTTFFANGNNIIIVGDLYRRVVRCRLDTKMERPEGRNFQNNPKEMILLDRGKYIAACLTIARAYIAAKRPGKCPQLGSFNEWSNTVRSALVWLGEADPVGSMDASKAADPETNALLTLLNEWTSQFGTGKENAVSSRQVIERCEENTGTGLLGVGGKDYTHTALRSAVLAVMPIAHNLKPDANALGAWLRSKIERRVGNRRVASRPATGHNPTQWWVEEEKPAAR